jgi:hypothetical protein
MQSPYTRNKKWGYAVSLNMPSSRSNSFGNYARVNHGNTRIMIEEPATVPPGQVFPYRGPVNDSASVCRGKSVRRLDGHVQGLPSILVLAQTTSADVLHHQCCGRTS